MPSRTGSRTSPSGHPRSGATTAPEQAPWASAEAEFRQLQQGASGAVELPASVDAGVLPAEGPEPEVVVRVPQVSRYSGSLFRQPLLLTSCPNPGSVGVVQNTQQKQEIQTHRVRAVNGPFGYVRRFQR